MRDEEPPGKDPKDQADSRSEEEGFEGDHLQVVQAKLVAIDEYTRGVGFLKTIAGITGLNVLLGLLGVPIRIIFGLRAAEFLAILGQVLSANFGVGAIVLGVGSALVLAGFFWVLGVLGLDRKRWPVYLAMTLYLADAGFCLFFGFYLELACHLYALHLVGSGLGGLKQLEKLEGGEVPA